MVAQQTVAEKETQLEEAPAGDIIDMIDVYWCDMHHVHYFQPCVCKCKLPPACWQKALKRAEELEEEKQVLQAMIAHAQSD